MPEARCVFEIYKVKCKCGEIFQALVEPQQIHAETTGETDNYQTSAVRCPSCKTPAVFLGPVARPVEIKGDM